MINRGVQFFHATWTIQRGLGMGPTKLIRLTFRKVTIIPLQNLSPFVINFLLLMSSRHTFLFLPVPYKDPSTKLLRRTLTRTNILRDRLLILGWCFNLIGIILFSVTKTTTNETKATNALIQEWLFQPIYLNQSFKWFI